MHNYRRKRDRSDLRESAAALDMHNARHRARLRNMISNNIAMTTPGVPQVSSSFMRGATNALIVMAAVAALVVTVLWLVSP